MKEEETIKKVAKRFYPTSSTWKAAIKNLVEDGTLDADEGNRCYKNIDEIGSFIIGK